MKTIYSLNILKIYIFTRVFMDYENAAAILYNRLLQTGKKRLEPMSEMHSGITEIFYLLSEYHPKALRTLIEELDLFKE